MPVGHVAAQLLECYVVLESLLTKGYLRSAGQFRHPEAGGEFISSDESRSSLAHTTPAARHELPAWLQAVEADELPELRSLAAGLRRDLAAVINGLTLEHSSGAVEGNVTRVKRLKRDGYGRANFDLLKAQILIAG
jgi:transposase